MSHRLLFAALFPFALAGCAAVSYTPISHDSPKPSGAEPGCLTADFAPGVECLALVRASEWWSDTGVKVQEGMVYRVTVPAGQSWMDAARVNEAPHGEPGSATMNLAARYKRHDTAWFSLIAAVAGPGMGVDRTELDWVDVGLVVGRGCPSVTFRARHAGTLTLYPNDARGPETHPTLFYDNNKGQVWVRVKWLEKAADPALARCERR